MSVTLTIRFTIKVFKHAFLANQWQESFYLWNIITSQHNLSLQNTIPQDQTLGWCLRHKKFVKLFLLFFKAFVAIVSDLFKMFLTIHGHARRLRHTIVMTFKARPQT